VGNDRVVARPFRGLCSSLRLTRNSMMDVKAAWAASCKLTSGMLYIIRLYDLVEVILSDASLVSLQLDLDRQFHAAERVVLLRSGGLNVRGNADR